MRVLLIFLFAASTQVSAQPHFAVRVTDSQTGRGVPLVEARIDGQIFITDSNGVIAFDDGSLLNRQLDFDFRSYGYADHTDQFQTTAGELETVAIDRTNLAERLYRATGTGIYRDSVSVGLPVPIAEPLLNANVRGQDSVQNAIYQGTLRWFWGDTLFEQPAGPFVGVFRATGATSALPSQGGLSPSDGVDYNYFVNPDNGYVRQVMPLSDPGPVWLDGLFTVEDNAGIERMLARFTRVQSLGVNYEQGLASYVDSRDEFRRAIPYSLDAPITPKGHSFRHTVEGVEYIYFAEDYPNVRVRADWNHVVDINQWEAFTPLAEGIRYDPDDPQFETDEQGNPVYGWKKNTDPLSSRMLDELVQAGELQRDRSPFQLKDYHTGEDVTLHRASVYWNEHRGKWIMIGTQGCSPGFVSCGDSFLGEVWFSEAPTPEGPWANAVKVATHDGPNGEYSFYNPKMHPYFNEQNGRIIYFEGTYSDTFGNAPPTPLYNYNQIMYRLDLDSIPDLTTLPGDYNHDGQVDALDFGVWQAEYGTSGASDADGNHDFVVDAADYTLWRDLYSAGLVTMSGEHPANIPEPSGCGSLVALLICGLRAGGTRRRRPLRHSFRLGRKRRPTR